MVVELAEHREVCEIRADATHGPGFDQCAKYDGLETQVFGSEPPTKREEHF